MAADHSDAVAVERSDVGNYDVFINFRGADTRQGFAYRLYDALVAEGIRVFVDDEELNKGRRLDEELPQAIDNSKIYITIISKRYASSKWCLRELAEIVRNKQEFKEKKEILPVFYKITVEDVKLKTKRFKNQLNRLKEKVPSETVDRWEETLKGIPYLKAWTVPIDGGYKQEGQYCRDIVKRVSIILRVKHKPLPKVLTGMEDPVEKVMQLLDIENSGFQVIGIHGIGGIGKTTLANVVYNKLCDDKFDCCCFMPDVRESLDNDKGSKNSLELQKKLLQQVSYSGDIDEIRDVDDAVRRIQLTLEGKKVLMVFDDVSDVDQILKLISNNGSIDKLNGSRNRIIITTRDDRVLQKNREFWRFTKIHTMQEMKDKHALELFSWHAFGKPMPPAEYVERSKDVVSLTGRLPLHLKTIGATFGGGRRENWEQKVEKLKNMLPGDVYKCLMISYEDLEGHTREVFLDIACFFVDKKVSHETHMWRACEFYPEETIEELISMCFVKIDKRGIYRMHDNIKDLGREIVRREGPEYKEQRSRIWKKKDAMDILTSSMKKKNNIKGILLEHEKDDEILTLKAENFVHLKKLRFLHLGGDQTIETVGSFKGLLPDLKWLSMLGIMMHPFSGTNFNLKKLVVLDFSLSDITESWAGWKEFKDLHSLEVLDLRYCYYLKKTPDLSQCMALKKLFLASCLNLEEIDRSIIYLKALEYLDISGCPSLRELPADEPLEDSTRPNSIGAGLVNLEHLSLRWCESLESLPNSITSLPKLRQLDLSWCKKLKKLPDSIGELEVHCDEMQGIQNEIEDLHCLREMSFDYSSICGLPSLGKLTRLEKLSLRHCNHLQQLPAELPASLVKLNISSESLQSIPNYSNLVHLTNMKLLLLESRGDLGEQEELNLSWVWKLSKLKKCWIKAYFTTTIQSEEPSACLSHLEDLTLCCSVLETRVVMPSFPALRKLNISLYTGAMSLSLPRLNRLTSFVLSYSGDLKQILDLGELESLISLRIERCNSLERLDDISKLRQLQTLEILWCKKLRVISVVPCLRSLKKLEIIRCELLKSLVGPSEESESYLDDLLLLEHLDIFDCPLLPNDLKRRLGMEEVEEEEEKKEEDEEEEEEEEEEEMSLDMWVETWRRYKLKEEVQKAIQEAKQKKLSGPTY